MLVSRRELAKALGVSDTAIRNAIKEGRITAIDPASNKLDKELAIKQFESTRIPMNNNRWFDRENHVPDGDDPETAGDNQGSVDWNEQYTIERALLTEEQKKLAHIARVELEAKLHKDEDLQAVWENLRSYITSRVMELPPKLADEISKVTKFKDKRRIEALLEESYREALAELARYDPKQINQARRRRTGK